MTSCFAFFLNVVLGCDVVDGDDLLQQAPGSSGRGGGCAVFGEENVRNVRWDVIALAVSVLRATSLSQWKFAPVFPLVPSFSDAGAAFFPF